MSIIIEKAGMLDTIQDAGRTGLSHWGINTNGPMDSFAMALANALLGNELNAPVIEMHFPAPIIRFTAPAYIALAGADFSAMLNDTPIESNRAYQVAAGSVLRFAQKKMGERIYLSARHGWQVPLVLGSYATNLKSGFGGMEGRALQKDDTIFFEEHLPPFSSTQKMSWYFPALVEKGNTLRIVKGPEWEWLSNDAQTCFLKNSFEISRKADRMGLHWIGQTLGLQEERSLLSAPVVMGTTQLLPSGQMLTLMADHQTVGGYPRVIQICKVDLSILAQATPGTKFTFSIIEASEAIALYNAQQETLLQIKEAVKVRIN
ncbi:MAG TPA: biotin-dependent carboxyltransferase family protein [Phnomibacter sp.]|nr:biotin-dependent carboxyltransferase family protein [Phnomibacter sp.]